MRNFISTLVIILSFAAVAISAEETNPTYDWQLEDTYSPPNFERFFPDDKEAGKKLDKLLLALRDELVKIRATQNAQPDLSKALSMINDPTLIRNGFRNASQRRSFLVDLMARKYLMAATPDPEILDIFYHAADPEDPYGTLHEAVYYCLSRLWPSKPPAVLRAFVDIAMTGNELDEIRGGCEQTGQLDELRSYLTPHLCHQGTKECEIAMLLDKYFGAESVENSMGLSMRAAQAIRKVKYAEVLAEARKNLSSSETPKRIEALKTMTQNRDLFRAVDESFLDLLNTCASDVSPLIRKQVPPFLRYISVMALRETQSVNTKALSALKKLAADEDQDVRAHALECLKSVESLDKLYEEARRHKAAR